MSFLSKLFHSISTTQQNKNISSQQYVNISGYNSKATLYKIDTLEEIESIPVPTSPFKYRCDFTKSIEYVLQRKATQFKREGNMDCAIACLKKALEIIPYAPMNYTNVDTRLENYLKIARRFSEAEALKNTQTENMRVSTFSSILSVQNMNDMIEVPKCSRICGECAKFHKRIYAKGGKKGFPDMKIFIDNKSAHQFASQGQQRTIVLSMKIALIELIKEEIGEYPILLLDDVLSELDDQRKTKLLDILNNRIQTFITTTSIDGIEHHVIKEAKKININHREEK